jgi:hypothetical protein
MKKRLGAVADEVFAFGDIDRMASSRAHREMLAAHESMEQHSVREATERFVGRLRARRDGIGRHLAARARHRADVAARSADRSRVVDQWREAGIRERMTIRGMPRASKWAIWVLIAALDFYIFAQVMAYAENIADPGLGDATFWLGGAVGLTVFIVGILLAQTIRRASYYHAQKRLLRELEAAGEDTSGLRPSTYSRWMTIAFAVFYVLLTAGAVVLRYQGGGKAQPGLLMLQTAIPIVAIMLELLMDDPTEIRLPERSFADWWLSQRLRRLETKIELRQLIANERLAAVADRYRFERAALGMLHEGHGIDPGPIFDDDLEESELTAPVESIPRSLFASDLTGPEEPMPLADPALAGSNGAEPVPVETTAPH